MAHIFSKTIFIFFFAKCLVIKINEIQAISFKLTSFSFPCLKTFPPLVPYLHPILAEEQHPFLPSWQPPPSTSKAISSPVPSSTVNLHHLFSLSIVTITISLGSSCCRSSTPPLLFWNAGQQQHLSPLSADFFFPLCP